MAIVNIDVDKLAGNNFEKLFLMAGNERNLYDSLTFESPRPIEPGSDYNTAITGNLKPESELYQIAKVKTFTFMYNRPLPWPSNLDAYIGEFSEKPTESFLRTFLNYYPINFSNVDVTITNIPDFPSAGTTVVGRIEITAKVDSLIYAGMSVIEYSVTNDAEPDPTTIMSGFTNNALYLHDNINGFTNTNYINLDT